MTFKTVQKVAVVRIEDPDYPRNARVRSYLESRGHTVVPIRRAHGSLLRRTARDIHAMIRHTRGADVILVPEFSLPYVPMAWAVARLRRARLVVDGFVGKYETVVDDWHLARPRSPRALWCRLVDGLAARLADITLTDTAVRAQAVRDRSHPVGPVVPLPVGAPDWITAVPCPPDGPLRVLFYGSVLPLHGIRTILEGLARTRDRTIMLTLVGGDRLGQYREVARRLGIESRCRFLQPCDPAALNRLIADHHVVLGTFGTSAKARSVIANKVWQGLAAGRPVITGASAAMGELQPLVGAQLVQVTDADELARALDELSACERTWYPHSAERLERYVQDEFDAFASLLERPAVLQAIDDMSGGGAQRVLCDLAGYAQKHGLHSVTVARDGVSVPQLPRGSSFVEVRGGFLGYLRTLDRACAKFRPVAINAHQRREALACRIVGRRRGIEVVEHAHTVLPRRGLKALSFRSRRIFSVGPAVSRMLREDFGRPASQIREVGNRVPPRALRPLPQRRRAGSRALKVIGVGRLTPQKDPFAFIDLVGALQQLAPVTASWLGDGELAEAAHRYAHNRGTKVDFAGHVDDVVARMDDADLLLVTSQWEGNPLVVLEAFARRLPVAGFPVPGVAEALEAGRGILLDKSLPLEAQARKLLSALKAGNDLAEAAWSYAQRFASPEDVYAPVIHEYLQLSAAVRGASGADVTG